MNIIHETSVLVASTKSGKNKYWQGIILEDGGVFYTQTKYWQQDGANQLSEPKVVSTTNIGKTNERGGFEQAKFNIDSLVTKQQDKGYSGEGVEKLDIVLPMLANKWSEKKHLIHFPVMVQPKLDGCVHGDTLILTNVGYIKIKEIVNKKLPVEILTKNENSGAVEYKKILNYFNNGKASMECWVNIKPEYGAFIKCTTNHKILTDMGWVEAENLDPQKHKIACDTSSYLNSLIAGTVLGYYSSFKVTKSRNMKPSTKYDLEIEDNHNYLANNIWVHNCRMLMQDGKAWSRKGKEFPEGVLNHILMNTNGMILDGELILDGTFQDTMRAVKKGREESKQLVFHVFDIVEDLPFLDRLGKLNKFLHESSAVKLVPTYSVESEEELFSKHAMFIQEGYEGTIIRTLYGKYEVNHRSSDLLKMKDFDDAEFTIVAVEEGDGRDTGAAIFVCITDFGDLFRVRPRGTMEYRQDIFQNSKEYLGKALTVRYQGLSEANIPRFPVGITIRDYE